MPNPDKPKKSFHWTNAVISYRKNKGGISVALITERYAGDIEGVLTCYDRNDHPRIRRTLESSGGDDQLP